MDNFSERTSLDERLLPPTYHFVHHAAACNDPHENFLAIRNPQLWAAKESRQAKAQVAPPIAPIVTMQPAAVPAKPAAPAVALPVLRGSVTFQMIVEMVGREFDVTPGEIRGPSRERGPSWSRFVVIWLAKCVLQMKTEDIARELGNRALTSIQHGNQRCMDGLVDNPGWAAKVQALRARLENR